MNGKKIYALLGSLSVALSCVTSAVVAKDAPAPTTAPQKKSAPAPAKAKFDEIKLKETSATRSTSTDDLFHSFKSASPDDAAATRRPGERSIPLKMKSSEPVSYSTSSRQSMGLDTLIASFKEEQKHSAPSAHKHNSSSKVAVTAKKPPAKAAGSNATALAVYKHANSGADNIAAVSHSIISNSATQVLQASLDKPGVMPRYRSGEHMVIKLHALQNCNVMVFDYDNKGTITQLYPNDYDKNGSLHSDETVEIGGEHSQYTLDVDGNGPEQIFVYAYPATEKIEVAMAPVPNTPFRSTKLTREQYDRLIAQSREYFTPATTETVAGDRGVKITQKSATQNVSVTTHPANKLQLVFEIEK
jgi:hypothetical protein